MKKLGNAQIGEHIWIRRVGATVFYKDDEYVYVKLDHNLSIEEYAELKDFFDDNKVIKNLVKKQTRVEWDDILNHYLDYYKDCYKNCYESNDIKAATNIQFYKLAYELYKKGMI